MEERWCSAASSAVPSLNSGSAKPQHQEREGESENAVGEGLEPGIAHGLGCSLSAAR
jgi:hypothetical protein